MTMEAEPVILRTEEIDRYIEELKKEGRSVSTWRKYKRMLMHLYEWLPEDKILTESVAQAFLTDRQWLYSVGTVNHFVSAFNGFMHHLGHREIHLDHMVGTETSEIQEPELSRDEYLRLLATARDRRDREAYLLVKTFANVPVHVQRMETLTVEAVRAERMQQEEGDIRLPEVLCRELERFALSQGIDTGPIFLGPRGKAMNRATIYRKISDLAEEAGVAPEKANPRCLHKMYLGMMDELRQEFEILMERSYNYRMQTEQLLIGWPE